MVVRSYGVAAIAPFSHRLAFNNLPAEIQRLRCHVNFEALQFVPTIRHLGDTLIERLQKTERQPSEGDPRDVMYLALHLRFDKVSLTIFCLAKKLWSCLGQKNRLCQMRRS